MLIYITLLFKKQTINKKGLWMRKSKIRALENQSQGAGFYLTQIIASRSTGKKKSHSGTKAFKTGVRQIWSSGKVVF